MTHSSQDDWKRDFKELYDLAVAKYTQGERGSATYFTPEQTARLAALGQRPQELYDFAEDAVKYGEPSYETALELAAIRRDYFLHEMDGKFSGTTVSMADLPPKDAKAEGIPWLPRIIVKAKAKLRGEMPDDLMYGCGGDRNFFREHGFSAAEFLHAVWMSNGNDQFVIDFVKGR